MLAAKAMSATPALSLLLLCRDALPPVAATVASIREQRHVASEIVALLHGASAETRTWLEGQNVLIAPMPSALTEPAATAPSFAITINAGIAAARGEWLLVLEAGDRLVGDMVLSEALNWLKRTEAGVGAGEVAYDTGRIDRLRSNVNPLAGDFLAGSGTFYRRGLFDENSGLDAAFPTMARYEWHVRLWKNRVRFKAIPLRIAATERPPAFSWREAREEMLVRHRYFPAWRCLRWDAWSLLCAARGRR